MGTLSAVARRNSDNVLVLVTNTHVVSNGVSVTQTGGTGEHAWTATEKDRFALDDENAYLYQFLPNDSDGATDVEANRVGQLYQTEEPGTRDTINSWHEAYRKKRDTDQGDIDLSRDGTTIADVAALKILPGVSADLGVHDPDDPDADDHNHPPRPIVAPCMAPFDGMSVTCFGANTGKREVEVSAPSPTIALIMPTKDTKDTNDPKRTLFRHTFPAGNYFTINQINDPSDNGDSGSPILWIDSDGNYRLVGIHFGSEPSARTVEDPNGVDNGIGYAIPASLVESLLDVTFGVKAPIADAGEGGQVVAGVNFSLDGRGSRAIEPGATITEYRWEQTHITAIPSLGTDTAQPTFTAPPRPGTLTFKLTVTDSNGAKHSTAVTVTVVNTPPTAKPGINRVVPVHTPPSLTPAVTLLGAAEDPDAGHAEDMDYEWSVFSAPASTTGSSTRSASKAPSSRVILATFIENGVEVPNKRTFTPDAIGDYVFKLTVTDPGDLTHSANVTIHACPANETSDWFDTGETRCHNNALQKRQTRRLSNGVTKFQWVADPDNEEWGAWQDTSASHRNEEPGDWINRGGPSGFYNVSFQSQRRTVAYEKQQRRTSACGNTEERWIAASRRESRTKLAGRTLSRPRTPIDSQWEVRRMNNKLQVKVTSLPTVTSSIIEVRARLEGGSTSDRAKVIKPIGTTLNTWVTVLSSSDDRWREGAWVAKIRFENSEKNSNYSATKPVTAPTTPTPPSHPPSPLP